MSAWPPSPGESSGLSCSRAQHPPAPTVTQPEMLWGHPCPRPFSAHESLNLPSPTLGLQAPQAHSLLCTKAPPFNSSSPIYFCYFINCLPVLPPKDVMRCKYDPPGPYSPLISLQGSCSSLLAIFPVLSPDTPSFFKMKARTAHTIQDRAHQGVEQCQTEVLGVIPIAPSQSPPPCSHLSSHSTEPPASGMAKDSCPIPLLGSNCQFSPFLHSDY